MVWSFPTDEAALSWGSSIAPIPSVAQFVWADAERRRRKPGPASPRQGAPTQQWVPRISTAPCSSAGSTVTRGPWKAQHGLGKVHVSLGMGKTESPKQPGGLASFGTARWGLALAPCQGWGSGAPAPGEKWDPASTQVFQQLLQKGSAHPLWKGSAE